MAITTVEVTGAIHKVNGDILPNAEVKIKLIVPYGNSHAAIIDEELSTPVYYIVSTDVISAVTDSNGNITDEQGEVLKIVPNELILPSNTHYSVCILDGNNISNITRWVLTNKNYTIGEIPYE